MEIISRKDAKALGLKRYFTGKPCKHGHISHRLVSVRQCIECAYKHTDDWRKANPDKVDEYHRTWHLANKKKNNERTRAWHKANPTYNRDWQRLNYEKRREYRLAWNEENPEKTAVYNHTRRARKAGNGGSHTAVDIADLYRLQGGRCACGCGELLKKKYHIDHIVPLALGGSNDRRNLQLLRPICNRRKYAKDPIAWAQENGRLL